MMENKSGEQAIFGYKTVELQAPEELSGTENWSAKEWKVEFERTRAKLVSFLEARDPFVVLARSAVQYLVDASKPRGDPQTVRLLEQVEVEISQALMLMGDTKRKDVPTSPGNFVRYWSLMSRHIHCFTRKNFEDEHPLGVTEIVNRKARLQTLYHRNLFTRNDCIVVVPSLLQSIDIHSKQALGYELSSLFNAMVLVADLIEARMQVFASNIAKLTNSTTQSEILEAIDFFRACYPLANRVWKNSNNRFTHLEDLRRAGFQMSEFGWPWVFTLDCTTLKNNFAPSIIGALKSVALPLGGQKGLNPDHIYLDNPIWKKPYIDLAGNGLFIPQAYLVFSFPFAIIESLISKHNNLESAYRSARAKYLESEVASIITKAMPNAEVLQSVVWTDPETGQCWENDVVAILGNFIFVFEAKSGRISHAAKRGAELSLKTNFRELFVEPGLQGWRLQDYLNRYGQNAVLRRKADNSIVDLRLDRPKVVYRYSVCFEHFTTISSARFYLKELGLIGDGTTWAPVITLGELQMMARYLDSELSFQHYLTRRQNLDELIDFDGDEQDVLSMYLINGLYIDPTTTQGRRVMFFESDNMVRTNKIPRQDRREPIILGVDLSPIWVSVVRELYADKKQRHRFDIINVILNQYPPALKELERNIRRFRRGTPRKDGDAIIIRNSIGKQTFVLACYLAKVMPVPEEWQKTARSFVGMFSEEDKVIECSAFIFCRRSKEITFDGVSFYRYGFGPKPLNVQ
jgi:hypothetical protein